MHGREAHCKYCHKDGVVNASISKKLPRSNGKAIQSMQKKIDELAQKLIEYSPTLQPLSPPQAQVYNAMQPATVFHSVPPASSHRRASTVADFFPNMHLHWVFGLGLVSRLLSSFIATSLSMRFQLYSGLVSVNDIFKGHIFVFFAHSNLFSSFASQIIWQ